MSKNVFAGSGVSKNDDPFKAGKEAVELALKNMRKQGGKKPNFGFVFCSGGKYGKGGKDIKKLVEGAHNAFMNANKDCKWIGCTTTGELSSYGYSTKSCVAMAVETEYIHVGTGVGERINENPKRGTVKAFEESTKDLKIDKYLDPYMQFLAMKRKTPGELIKYSPFHIITLIQGPLKKPGREDEVVSVLKSIVGNKIPITGGSSADDFNFIASYQFCNGKIYTDSVIMMTLISHLKLGTGTKSGFKLSDKSFIVTDCHGRVIHKLDGKPAAQVLAKAYGSTVKKLSEWVTPGFQRCFFLNDTSPILIAEGPGLHRVAVFHMIQGNDVIIGSGVVNNTAITLGRMTKEDMINAAPASINEVKKEVGGDLAALICFDCCMRQQALKEDIKKENKVIMKAVGKTPIVGFYTYGEQGFMKGASTNHMNYTVTCLGISDRLMSNK